MKAAAVIYTAFAAVLAFALGGIQSCVERMQIKVATPEEIAIPEREWKVDALPYPSEYEGEDGELYYFTTTETNTETVDL